MTATVTITEIIDQILSNQRRFFDTLSNEMQQDGAHIFGNPNWWADLQAALAEAWEGSILPNLISIQPMRQPVDLIEFARPDGDFIKHEVKAVPRMVRSNLPAHVTRDHFHSFFNGHQVELTREVFGDLWTGAGHRHDAPHPLEFLAQDGDLVAWVEERIQDVDATHVMASPAALRRLGLTVPSLETGEIRRVLDPRPISFWADTLFPTKRLLAWSKWKGNPLVIAPYLYQWTPAQPNPTTFQLQRVCRFRYAKKLTDSYRIAALEIP